VVVVGGGFGGLEAVRRLRHVDVDITLIDRHNYHLFQPLSYQVATGSLSPGEIAVPLRRIFRRQRRVRVLVGEVTGFDLQHRQVAIDPTVAGTTPRRIPYDTLIVAGGSSYAYFGNDQWRSTVLEVKSLDSALHTRARILQAFEAAELETDPATQAAWLTFVVVGGGPTGVEMAGQIAELARDTLPTEFRHSDPRSGRVLLVETADRVLSTFAPSLSHSAARSLSLLGVTSLLAHTVVGVYPDCVEIQAHDGDRTRVATRTVVWAAGVSASPLARDLADAVGGELDRAGRLAVAADLTLPGHPEVLAIGDMVTVRDPHSGQPRTLPGVAPVAMQQGRYAARLISDRLAGLPTPAFRYRDKGTLATIGRARAVASFPLGVRLSGYPAWLTWLFVHLFYLIGFENRILVVVRWAYSFFTHGRGARLITGDAAAPPGAPSATAPARESPSGQIRP
jgi:NADH:ubiquinone reductase (H+-translocating)